MRFLTSKNKSVVLLRKIIKENNLILIQTLLFKKQRNMKIELTKLYKTIGLSIGYSWDKKIILICIGIWNLEIIF